MTDPRERLQNGLAERYRLDGELGRGGMATVYLAQDLKHDRPVALKLLHQELAAALGPERFLREIRTAARLQHPHILGLLDSGETAGLLWYTMPYVEGESLRDRLRREVQLPVEDAIRISRDTALALDYAHRHGVVHRDIKPENILLSDRQALVADFGVAQALDPGGGGKLTGTGIAVGTPAYMSPEQASAGQVDARSDIYALGCVLYEMLTGEPPFSGSSAQAIMAKRFSNDVPRVRVLRPTVPEPVEQAVTKALARAAADRYATAADFCRALDTTPVITTSGTTLGPSKGPTGDIKGPTGDIPTRSARHVFLAVATLGLGLLIGVGVLFAWLRTGPSPDASGPKRVAVLPFENLGHPDDEYFTDGITEEVRGKLAGLPGLQVIARSSSVQYKDATKSPRQIGEELGVEYLLTGTVRWEKNVEGQSRVRVSPELIQASTGSTRWQEPFDALLTDVFKVQADLATHVANALGVTLQAGEREQLAEKPTQNLAAYDAYLRALDARFRDAPTAAAGFERAVALDSTFALAWAELALTRQYYHSVGFTLLEQVERSKADAERALALQPRLPLAHYALGEYYRRYGNYDRALAEYARGLAVAASDVRLLSGVARVDLHRGQGDQALETARRLRPLDPRSPVPLWVEASALMYLRRFPEVFAVLDQAMVLDSLNPEWYRMRIESHAAQGDVEGAHRALDLAERRLGYTLAVTHWGRQYEPWVLPDSARAFLLRLRPSAMENDTADWALTLAFAAKSLGQTRQARAYADTARRVLEARRADLAALPDLRTGLCLAYAFSGRPDDARQTCEALLTRPSPDATWSVFEVVVYARAAVELGDTDGAVSVIERLAQGPGWPTPAWLRLDPTFAPLRGHPRFERAVH